MTADAPPGASESVRPVAADATHRQVRGSSVLLVGRVLAAVIGFATQVLIVRTLTKDDYGVFAYGLSLVTLAETTMALGLDRAVTRFVPIYTERAERAKATGTIAAVVGLVLVLGAAVVGFTVAFPEVVGGGFAGDRHAERILLILILLAPVQAIDNLLIGLFAVFDRPRAIFLRRFVMGPSLRLLVVVLLAVSGGDAAFLAVGYVAAAVLGVVLYGGISVRLLRSVQLLGPGSLRGMQVPGRELLLFALPLFSTDLVFVMLESMDALLVGRFQGPAEVAELRAVQPLGRLNQLVLASFGLLFTPVAARLYAHRDDAGIAHLYWRSAIWVAALSFPFFAVSFALADPVTLLLFGSRYHDSAVVLTVLSVGYFTNAAMGFNGLTLNVYGLVWPVLGINVAALVLNLGLNLALIPSLGAVGAAIGTSSTLVVQNLLRQVLLARRTAVPPLSWTIGRIYLVMVGGVAGLSVGQAVLDPPVGVGLASAAVVSGLVVVVASRSIDLEGTFPEVARLPLLRFLAKGGR